MVQFKTLMNEVEGQSEDALITFFLGGLKQEIRLQMKVCRPTSLQKAFAMAKAYEAQKVSKYHKSGVFSRSNKI